MFFQRPQHIDGVSILEENGRQMILKNIRLRYLLCLAFIMGSTLSAQDLEPRRWTPLPEGTTILGITYGHHSGDVGFDPVLDIENTKVKRDFLIMSYSHFFMFSEKLMRFDVLLPFHKVEWDGLLSGESARVERTGLGDPHFRFSVNLLDKDTKVLDDPTETVNTVVGAAIAVGVPLGEYFEDKLLNLSANRYSIRPQIGVVHTRGPWSYELTGSVFFFTDNDRFLSDSQHEQKAFYAAQAHIVRVFTPGIWGSLSGGYGQGGASKVNGISKEDEREGFIAALSFGIPLTPDQSLKCSYIWAKTQTDIETRSSTDTFTLGWSIRF